jgi:hypothetical protein
MWTSLTGYRWAAVLFIGVILVASSAQAIDLGPGQPCAAIKFGRLGEGTVKVTQAGNTKRESRVGSAGSFGVAFDFPLNRYLYAGIGVDWQFMGEGISESFGSTGYIGGIELSAHLKGLFSFHSGRYAIRPGVGVGGLQGHYTSLALRGMVEFQASISERLGVGFEAGFWSIPIGTDDRKDISLDPVRFVRAQFLISMHSNKNGSNGQ